MPDSSQQRRGRAFADRLSGSPLAMPALAVASLLETLIVPLPIELLLVPWMLMEPARKWRLAAVTLAGCLTGALLFDEVGRPLLERTGDLQAYERFTVRFERWGFWGIVAVGVLPIPFQAAMLAAGVAGYPLWLYLPAAVLARGVRYFGLALLVHLTGERALEVWRRRRVTVTVVATLLIVAAALVSRRLAAGV